MKGVSKRMIEIRQPDSAYFERVYLIVREGEGNYPEGFLRRRADEYVREMNLTRRRARTRVRLALLVGGVLTASVLLTLLLSKVL